MCIRDSRRIDPQAVYDFVAMSIIPSPLTVYCRVRKVPAHHVLEFDGQVSLGPYCRLTFPEDADISPDEMGREVRRVITGAVARRRRSDPPDARIGAFLSGGLDSSTVVGALTAGGDRPTRAFSIGFSEPRFDEMDYARLAAEHFGAEHHTHVVTAAEMSAAVDDILDQYDEPFGNSSAVGVYSCARLAGRVGVNTLYAGDGGDEIFAGNPHYLTNRYFQFYHAVPGWLRRGVVEPVVFGCPLGGRIGLIRKARSYIRRANTPNPERLAGYEFLEATAPHEVFRADFLARVDPTHPMLVRRQHYDRAGESSELAHILCQDLALVVSDNDLRKVTEMCTRAGIRVVYPMLDPEVVALASRIPAPWHLRGLKLRAFYKRAMRGFLPPEILAKRKRGFGLPVGVWLRDDPSLGARVRDAFAGRAATEVFKEGFLSDLLHRMRTDQTNYYGAIVWVVLILVEWLSRHGCRGASVDWGSSP